MNYPSLLILIFHFLGLQDLTLSGNAGVTAHGWSKFFIALAAGSELQTLHIDYNNIMDYGTGCLAVALAASKTLKFVDLESCGLTELGGQVCVVSCSMNLVPHEFL